MIENGILVLQCGFENTHIGKLEFVYNKATDAVEEYSWEMIPVDEDHCPSDKYVSAMINSYEYEIENKYSKLITTLKMPLDNYGRGNPTEVGQLFADAFQTLEDYLYQHKDLGGPMDDRCIIRGNVGGLALEVKKRREEN